MRRCRINLPNRCYHLISRVAHCAFEWGRTPLNRLALLLPLLALAALARAEDPATNAAPVYLASMLDLGISSTARNQEVVTAEGVWLANLSDRHPGGCIRTIRALLATNGVEVRIDVLPGTKMKTVPTSNGIVRLEPVKLRARSVRGRSMRRPTRKVGGYLRQRSVEPRPARTPRSVGRDAPAAADRNSFFVRAFPGRAVRPCRDEPVRPGGRTSGGRDRCRETKIGIPGESRDSPSRARRRGNDRNPARPVPVGNANLDAFRPFVRHPRSHCRVPRRARYPRGIR